MQPPQKSHRETEDRMVCSKWYFLIHKTALKPTLVTLKQIYNTLTLISNLWWQLAGIANIDGTCTKPDITAKS